MGKVTGWKLFKNAENASGYHFQFVRGDFRLARGMCEDQKRDLEVHAGETMIHPPRARCIATPYFTPPRIVLGTLGSRWE